MIPFIPVWVFLFLLRVSKLLLLLYCAQNGPASELSPKVDDILLSFQMKKVNVELLMPQLLSVTILIIRGLRDGRMQVRGFGKLDMQAT